MKVVLWIFCCFIFINHVHGLIQVASLAQSASERTLIHNLWLYHNLTKTLATKEEEFNQVELVFIDYNVSHEIPEKGLYFGF